MTFRYLSAWACVALTAANIFCWFALRGDTWITDYNLVGAGWSAAWAIALLMEGDA